MPRDYDEDNPHLYVAKDTARQANMGDNRGLIDMSINNTLNQQLLYVFSQEYKGRNAKRRRSIQHDLRILQNYPDGKARDELIASIEKQTTALIEHEDTPPSEMWARRLLVVGVSVVAAGALIIFGAGVTVKHSLIAHGHPNIPGASKWWYAIENVGAVLSPRGNRMPQVGEAVPVTGPNPKGGDPVVYANVKLMNIGVVSSCDPRTVDRVVHPKNRWFVRLDFEVTGGDAVGFRDVDLLSRRQFSAYTLNEQKSDIGNAAGSNCIPDAVLDGPRDIPPKSTQRFTILADVLSDHGYIDLGIDPEWPVEWRY